jgi:hypothetical protein
MSEVNLTKETRIVELVPQFPCVEASKLRSVDANGKLVFDRWCIKHHHWLNDAPQQRTVLQELIASVKP